MLIQNNVTFKLFVLEMECFFKAKLKILEVEVLLIYQANEFNYYEHLLDHTLFISIKNGCHKQWKY